MLNILPIRFHRIMLVLLLHNPPISTYITHTRAYMLSMWSRRYNYSIYIIINELRLFRENYIIASLDDSTLYTITNTQADF